jgi:hypothetical protein
LCEEIAVAKPSLGGLDLLIVLDRVDHIALPAV